MAQLCRKYPPGKVETIGERIVEYLDPDGTVADDCDRSRHRGLNVGDQADNLMSKVAGFLDPTTRALLDVMLAVWAAKGMNNPASGAADDPALDLSIPQAAADNDNRSQVQRSQVQRNHDAFKAMLLYLIESGQLGKTHRGLPVQVIISMTKGQVRPFGAESSIPTLRPTSLWRIPPPPNPPPIRPVSIRVPLGSCVSS